ncbi:copper resistance protein CopC [Microbispora hainanensis]|uniref:Copper resistance protein CopC n=1 Tax=Microbispora hainanensis TaxID=568844 RepID=A0ABZ1SZE2_9ACTN|nr:copper resistance protein CopC [Microbispora hainanensis]
MDQVARMDKDTPPTHGGRRRLRVLAAPHGPTGALAAPRRRLRVLAMPLLALLSVLLIATPAQAHDVLVGSDPKDGAVLGTMPSTVTLTFDQAVRRDFARMAVTGPDGAHYEQGEITVDGRNVSIGVRTGTPSGDYAIGYRIVSNDGHPVTGAVKFTVTGGGAAPGAVTAPTAASATGTANSGAGTTGTGTVGQSSGSWVWGLLAITAALLALCTRVLVRHDRRLRDGTIPAPPAAGTPRAASAGIPDSSNTAPSSTAPSGTAPSGTEPSSTEPSSTAPSSAGPSGRQPSGTAPSGTEPSSAEPSGEEPSRTEASGTEAPGAPGSGAGAAGTSAADSGADGPATGRSTAAGTGAGSSPASGGAA